MQFLDIAESFKLYESFAENFRKVYAIYVVISRILKFKVSSANLNALRFKKVSVAIFRKFISQLGYVFNHEQTFGKKPSEINCRRVLGLNFHMPTTLLAKTFLRTDFLATITQEV